jgi:heme oxygenase
MSSDRSALPSDGHTDDVLTQLRRESRDEHEAIERVLEFMDEGLTRDVYRRRLAQFYGFYAPLEERLGALGAFTEPGTLRTAPRLAADLRALGLASPESLPRCDALPTLTDRASVLGCLYVLKGAALGGRVIARHVAKTLGLGPDNGACFFHGAGEETGPRWRTFVATLADFDGTAAERHTLVHTAIDTFRTLRLWCQGGTAP